MRVYYIFILLGARAAAAETETPVAAAFPPKDRRIVLLDVEDEDDKVFERVEPPKDKRVSRSWANNPCFEPKTKL